MVRSLHASACAELGSAALPSHTGATPGLLGLSGGGSGPRKSTLDGIREEEAPPAGGASPVDAAAVDAGLPRPPPIRTRRADAAVPAAALFSEGSGPITQTTLEKRQKLLQASFSLDGAASLDAAPPPPHLGNPLASLNSPVAAGDGASARSPESSRASANPLPAPGSLQRLPTPPSGGLSAGSLSRRPSWRGTAGHARGAPAAAAAAAPPPPSNPCLSRSFSWPYCRALAALDFQGRSRDEGMPGGSPRQSATYFSHLFHPTAQRRRQALNARYALLHKRLMAQCVPLPRCARASLLSVFPPACLHRVNTFYAHCQPLSSPRRGEGARVSFRRSDIA